MRACVRAWVFCDVFSALFFTLSSVNSKRAKTKQISTKKKVSWVCLFVIKVSKALKDYDNKKGARFWALERKNELNEIKLASSKGVEEIHHLVQETLPSFHPPNSPPLSLSLCIM
jgi:hypothetical protein